MNTVTSAITRSAVLVTALFLIFTAFGSSLTSAEASAELVKAEAAGTFAVRTLRALPANGTPGGQVTVALELESLGDEVATSFTLNFDPTKLNTPELNIGSGVPGGTSFLSNLNDAPIGRIGMLLDSFDAFAVSPPARQIVLVRFNVAPGAAHGPTPITFGSTPTPRSASNSFGNLIDVVYQGSIVTIGSAQAPLVQVSGRVVTPSGVGLRNATVSITDASNNRTLVTTSTLGFYSFQNVESGRAYTVAVTSKKFRFAPVVVQVNDNVANLDFAGLE